MKYLDVEFETVEENGLHKALLAGVPVIGTHSQSKGEAIMRFSLMLEALQDWESKPVQPGDLVEMNGEVGVITNTEQPMMTVRMGIGDGTVNFRDFVIPHVPYPIIMPVVNFNGETIDITPKSIEWQGVGDVEFSAFDSFSAEQYFNYTREVNIWKVSC